MRDWLGVIGIICKNAASALRSPRLGAEDVRSRSLPQSIAILVAVVAAVVLEVSVRVLAIAELLVVSVRAGQLPLRHRERRH